MDASLLVSFGSVLIALVALILSMRQTGRQNLLPVALDVFRESRTAEWFQAREWVINRLTDEHGPDSGVSVSPKMPPNWRVGSSSSMTTSVYSSLIR